MANDFPSAVPLSRYQVIGRPLVVVVHATKKYDRQTSTKQPIDEVLSKIADHFDVLEIVDQFSRSYLELTKINRTSTEYQGNLLHQQFFTEVGHLIAGANTFLFIGGRANRCLLNAFLSILVAKLSPLEEIFAHQDSIMSTSSSVPRLLHLPTRQATTPLNFHFNCEAIYPSHDDLRAYSRNPEVLDWSPNIPWQVMARMVWEQRRIFAGSGLNIHDFVDGKPFAGPVTNGSRLARPINLLYWSSLPRPKARILPPILLATERA